MLWDPSSPSEAPLYILVRWLSFSAIVLAIGALLFPRVMRTALRPVVTDETAGAVDAAIRRIVMASALAVAGAALIRLVMQRAMLNAAFAPDVTPWGDVLGGAFGAGFWLQLAGGLLAVVASGRRDAVRTSIAILAIAAMAVSPGLSGHAAAGSPIALTLAADAIHMVAAGAWVGVLAVLILVALPVVRVREPEASGLATPAMVAAFSPVALGSVALLAISGVYAAWRLVGSFDALFSTRYGAALLVKVVLLLMIFAIGAVNWRRLGPASGTTGGAVRFRRAASAELAVAILVLLVTAALVGRPTPLE